MPESFFVCYQRRNMKFLYFWRSTQVWRCITTTSPLNHLNHFHISFKFYSLTRLNCPIWCKSATIDCTKVVFNKLALFKDRCKFLLKGGVCSAPKKLLLHWGRLASQSYARKSTITALFSVGTFVSVCRRFGTREHSLDEVFLYNYVLHLTEK